VTIVIQIAGNPTRHADVADTATVKDAVVADPDLSNNGAFAETTLPY